MKSLVNTKSTLITKKNYDLKTVEKNYFLFPDSPCSVMLIKKKLPVVFVDNDIDTDRTFNSISESILTWENSDEFKLSPAEIQSSLSKLSAFNSKLDTLTKCLCEVVSDQEIAILWFSLSSTYK